MAVRRQQGLCYSCEEQFAPGHLCKKLFVLEVDPFLVDDKQDPDIERREVMAISLAAIIGI